MRGSGSPSFICLPINPLLVFSLNPKIPDNGNGKLEIDGFFIIFVSVIIYPF